MLALISLLIQSVAAPLAPAGAPALRCDVNVGSWCLGKFEGSLSLKQTLSSIRWTIVANNSPDAGSIIIEEDHSCRFPSMNGKWSVQQSLQANGRALILKDQVGGCVLSISLKGNAEIQAVYSGLIGDAIMLQSSGGMKRLRYFEGFDGR
jgi:hypothetical protein